MDAKFDGWPHIIYAQQFSREWIERILFPKADEMEKRILRKEKGQPLAGKEMISLFCQESTRTRASFEMAMRKLGGQVVFGSEAANHFSAMAMGKDESLEDTIITLSV